MSLEDQASISAFCPTRSQVQIHKGAHAVEARQALADLLAVQPPPFAICAYNDDFAFATLATLFDLNIAMPEAVMATTIPTLPNSLILL